MSTDPSNSSSASDASASGPLGARRGPLPVGQRKPTGDRPKSEASSSDQPAGDAELSAQAQEVADDAARDKQARKAKQNYGPKPAIEIANRRAPLSADLQAEIDEALGGLSLNELVSDGGLATKASTVETDSQHRAQVVEIHGDNVFFALGGKNQGVASLRSFATPPEVGSMLDVVVNSFNTEDNLYEVSVAGGKLVAGNWSDIREGGLVDAKIVAANTGGLECEIAGGVRGFIPASQAGLYRVENLGDLVGQRITCVITEANERRGNVVLSRRAVLEREKESAKKELMASIAIGDMREGVVRKIQDFGAFVDMGGIDGLIHISQMSWDRIKHPSEILTEGQKVRVRIEKIDPETGKIGLSLRNQQEHPWTGIDQKFPVGSIVKGTVSRLAAFGAFVKLSPGVEGLIHISELAHNRVYAVQNVVKEGQEVEVKILTVSAEDQRISLSLKATLQAPAKSEKTKAEAAPEVDEPPRAPVVPKRSGPLKGGAGKSGGGGEAFGLKW
ncbi:RNA binding S1 domain protein [Pirellula staleyi DSM 6068]|uniref:RNA binding S1 domain protein n=1 Tax=Pirellula staleyi (strain ATCC 27377 / DSM 6068 / ICPB 4128) TaxID=530564 RepID=D2R2F1_PIRSD|nr:S1 RNA-binding domain-containing protein [Pirellula staleyi]ADB15060.1 RNA binding S1 domain protein [Pirellula staleyi DSM 6068]